MAEPLAETVDHGMTPEGIRVDRSYREILGRASDPDGRKIYENRLRTGTSLSRVRRELMTSGEFREGLTKRAETHGRGEAIEEAYRRILGREIDDEGRRAYIDGGYTTDAVIDDVVASGEFRDRQREIIQGELNALYHDVLRREGDEDGLAFYSNQVEQGRSLREIREELAGSREFLEGVSTEHALTWFLELGDHGTGYGDLETGGFEARNSNHSSGQDGFAVSRDHRKGAVADGMGGYGSDHDGTAFYARFIADYAVVHGVAGFFSQKMLYAINKGAEIAFGRKFEDKYREPVTERHGRLTKRMLRPPLITSELIGSVGATLTYLEVIDATHVRLVAIGDSPAYVLDEENNIVQQYGEDAQSGQVDQPLAHKLGRDRRGIDIVPKKGVVRDGRSIVDVIIEVPKGGKVAIGSDYFSETISKGGFQLKDFIGLTAEEFHAKVKAVGKRDDATLVVVDPAKVAA